MNLVASVGPDQMENSHAVTALSEPMPRRKRHPGRTAPGSQSLPSQKATLWPAGFALCGDNKVLSLQICWYGDLSDVGGRVRLRRETGDPSRPARVTQPEPALVSCCHPGPACTLSPDVEARGPQTRCPGRATGQSSGPEA